MSQGNAELAAGLTRSAAGSRPVLGVPVEVETPATSANLGPGFDALGLALAYGDRLSVRAGDGGDGTFASDIVSVSGEGAESLPTDGTHLAARTIRVAWDAWGVEQAGVALRIDAENRIPHGRGQGSSAAIIVASVAAAAGLIPADARPSTDDIFELAARIEGHPDNVAPAVYGGLSVSWSQPADARDGRRFRAAVLGLHPDVDVVVAIPDVALSTEAARGLLPSEVPHADAAANAARAALLVHALAAEPALLPVATQDLLHQDYRAPAMPASHALVCALRERGFAAAISGAGPTVMVLVNAATDGDAIAARAALEELTAAPSHGAPRWRVLAPGIDRAGVRVAVHASKDRPAV